MSVSFPSLTPNSSDSGIIVNKKQFISPLTGYTQQKYRKGNRWFQRLLFNNLSGVDRGVLMGYLAFIEAQGERIECGDFSYLGANGALGGTPLVDGASQVGTSIDLKGFPLSTLVLKAGDQFSFDNGITKELKMVTSDATTDGSGNVTVQIFPEIRISPADNAAIETADPVGTFLLVEPMISLSNRPKSSTEVFSDIPVSLIEDIATE